MHRCTPGVRWTLLLLGLAACASTPAPPPSPRPLPAPPPAAAAPDEALPPDAGPADYVRVALARNQGLRAARLRVEELGERVPQAEAFDDPMLTVAPLGEMAETAAGQVGLMTGLSQKLPFFGKRDARGRIAAQEVAVAVHEWESARLAVIRDTLRGFWTLYETTRDLEVIQEDRALMERFHGFAQANYAGGLGAEQDVLQASVVLSELDNRILTLGQRRDTARALLNRMLDRPVSAPLPVPAARDLGPRRFDLDTLLRTAQESNPALHALAERIEQDRQKERLAGLARWPDVTVGFNWNQVADRGLAPSADGTDQWWVGLGLNLPLWTGRLDAAEREAEMARWRHGAELSERRNDVAFRVQDAYARVDTQQRLALLFRDVILPEARLAVDAASSAYQASEVEFVTLVDSWRKLLEFDLLYHQSVAEYERAVADLEQVVGQPLEDLMVPAPNEEDR